MSIFILARVGPRVLFGVLLGGLLGASGTPWGTLGSLWATLGSLGNPFGLLGGAPGRPWDSFLRDLDVFFTVFVQKFSQGTKKQYLLCFFTGFLEILRKFSLGRGRRRQAESAGILRQTLGNLENFWAVSGKAWQQAFGI